MTAEAAALVALIDRLEEQAASFLTLEEVERAAGRGLAPEIADGLLLVDYRRHADGRGVTLCRLNRHHPLVQSLTAW